MPADPLHAFLAEELDADVLGHVEGLLAPLYERALAGRYALLPEAELEAGEIQEALATATQKRVRRLHFLSCSVMPSPSAGQPAEPRFRHNLCETLRASLGNTLWVSLQASLRVSMLVNLESSLSNSLGNGLRQSLQATLGDRLWAGLGGNLWNSMWDSLFYFLGFHVGHKEAQADRLEPLIRLYPKCLPVDEQRDVPGVWIVLVA